MKDENAAQAIQKAFKQADLQMTTGKYAGTVLLTPSCVTRPARMSPKSWKPAPWTPRYNFVLWPTRGTKALWTHSWKRPSDRKKVTVGIYKSGIDFPIFCCKCMAPVTHYEIIQLGTIERSVSFQAPGIRGKKAELVAEAWSSKRYWYAVPFCEAHSLSSKAVTFIDAFQRQDNKIVLGFTNREYGRLFGELNRVEGKWLGKSGMLVKDWWYWALLVGVLGALIALASPLRFVGVLMVLAVLVYLGAVVVFWLEERKNKVSDT